MLKHGWILTLKILIICASFDKFDVSNVLSYFLADQNTMYIVNGAFVSLESSLRT